MVWAGWESERKGRRCFLVRRIEGGLDGLLGLVMGVGNKELRRYDFNALVDLFCNGLVDA